MASGPHCTRTGLIAGKGRTRVGIGAALMRWRRDRVKAGPGNHESTASPFAGAELVAGEPLVDRLSGFGDRLQRIGQVVDVQFAARRGEAKFRHDSLDSFGIVTMAARRPLGKPEFARPRAAEGRAPACPSSDTCEIDCLNCGVLRGSGC